MSIVEAEHPAGVPVSVSVEIGGKESRSKPGSSPSRQTAPSSSAMAIRSCSAPRGPAEPREGIDFFPLTVEYEERMYAAGKIPAAFQARGTPDRDRDPGRAHDRPPHPAALPEGLPHDTQIIDTVFSADMENAADILASSRSRRAHHLGLPFQGPIGAVRMGSSMASSSSTRRCRSMRIST